MNHNLKAISKKIKSIGADEQKWLARAEAIKAGLHKPQRDLLEDTSKFKSARCPRRSGKSFSFTSIALERGERHPKSRILIISLTLGSTKENFWEFAPGGIFEQDRMYGLNLEFNRTELTWVHENGSRGRIVGAETKADIEKFRGAPAEADLIIIDEGKSFAPDLLQDLIRDVVRPGLMTRDGSLILGGTPGSIPMGLFYEATSTLARVKFYDEDLGEEVEVPTCKQYDGTPLDDDDHRWSLHSWTIQDNVAKPKQWANALRTKKASNWADDNPVWMREYLGEWVSDISDLVYAYGTMKLKGKGFWIPDLVKGNPKTGLPDSEGPWHLVMGIDLGVKDDCAIVVLGWSDTRQLLREVYSWKKANLDISQLAAEMMAVMDTYGTPEIIVADKGALGLMIINEMNNRYGLNIIAAEKRLKYDHQLLLNDDIMCGRVEIIKDSPLDHELCGLQWKLDPTQPKKNLVLIRKGKLEEDPSCPNHICDAFLYSWRFCYSYFAKPVDKKADETEDTRALKRESESIKRMLDAENENEDKLVAKLAKLKEKEYARRA